MKCSRHLLLCLLVTACTGPEAQDGRARPSSVAASSPSATSTSTLPGQPKGEILLGRIAASGQFNEAVAFVDRDRPTRAFCGGTLVGAEWVLTASHCRVKKADDVAILRVVDLAKSRSEDQTEITQVCEGRMGSDLALIRLGKRFQDWADLSSLEAVDEAAGALRIAGWGLTEKGTLSRELRYGDLPMISREACEARVGPICADCVCAWKEGIAVDACYSDSGGPGLLFGARGYHSLAVVIREGIGCGQLPGIYTFVPPHRKWIGRVVETGRCQDPNQG